MENTTILKHMFPFFEAYFLSLGIFNLNSWSVGYPLLFRFKC